MPNWCRCQLVLRGDEDDLNEFADRARAASEGLGALSLGAFVPAPPTIRDQPYDPAEYEWRIQHWGTKWDLDEQTNIIRGTTFLSYGFWTANSPPVAWLQIVSKQFPNISFCLSYDEPNMGLVGRMIIDAPDCSRRSKATLCLVKRRISDHGVSQLHGAEG